MRSALAHRLNDLSATQHEARLGDRPEQRFMIDPHLYAAAKLRFVQRTRDGDHRRAIEIRAADARREIRPPGSERRDAEARHAGHACSHVGCEAGGAFVSREHEVDAACAHGFHERQYVPAGDADDAFLCPATLVELRIAY